MHYMHYKHYIHHDFYAYSPVLLTQYLGHCWHTPCTELYILRIRCVTLLGCWENPPSPATGGGEPSGWGGGGVWGSLLIYIYNITYIHILYIEREGDVFSPSKITSICFCPPKDSGPVFQVAWLAVFWCWPRCQHRALALQIQGKTMEDCTESPSIYWRIIISLWKHMRSCHKWGYPNSWMVSNGKLKY